MQDIGTVPALQSAPMEMVFIVRAPNNQEHDQYPSKFDYFTNASSDCFIFSRNSIIMIQKFGMEPNWPGKCLTDFMTVLSVCLVATV